MNRVSWTLLALIPLACASGYLAGAQKCGPSRGDAPAATSFLDEMQEINSAYAARLGGEAERLRGEALSDACRAHKLRYDEQVRDCYGRHGRPLPEHLKPQLPSRR